jgi:hypothetical protein
MPSGTFPWRITTIAGTATSICTGPIISISAKSVPWSQRLSMEKSRRGRMSITEALRLLHQPPTRTTIRLFHHPRLLHPPQLHIRRPQRVTLCALHTTTEPTRQPKVWSS